MNIGKFLIYNNTVPIVLGILFISSGLVFAASEEVRGVVADAVYEVQETVISVDNSYIINKDLNNYTPRVSINNVTEDEEFYYVAYTFTTIGLEDYIWQDVAQSRVMNVAKTALGQYKDLGVYVTEQLKQVVDREIAYLKELQSIERRQASHKVVATAYSGLVGQFIDDSTQQLPGYVPRVSEPVFEEVDPVSIARAEKSDVVVVPPSQQDSQQNSEQNQGGTNSQPPVPSGPIISILGANPARIPLGASYSDLGVVVTSQTGITLDLTVKLALNGTNVGYIDIDTSEPKQWVVTYSVTDNEGAKSSAKRTVIVYDPNAPSPDEETKATSTASTTSTTTSTQSTTTGTTTATSTTNETTTQSSTSTTTSTEENAKDSTPTPVTEVEEEETVESATTTQEDEVSTTEDEESTSNESATSTATSTDEI